MKNENFTINEIEQKLKRYCSYQDRCHSGVEKKIKEFDLIEEAKNKILFNLINENYLNESRFSENFVRGKFKIKNWGKIKIVQELKSRNISDINIKRGLMEIDEVEYKNKLENIFNKKLSSLGNQSVINKKKKIFSYLSYRGWETNLIYEKINQIQ